VDSSDAAYIASLWVVQKITLVVLVAVIVSPLSLTGFVAAEPNVHRPSPTPRANLRRRSDIRSEADFGACGAESASWHLSPTFSLGHPTTLLWWAIWVASGVALSDYLDLQRRIAAHYGADAKISKSIADRRLAGFDRWKDGKNYGHYELSAVS